MAASEDTMLRFQPIQTIIDPSFWHDLGALKLDTLRLSEEVQPLTGFHSAANSEQFPAYLQFDSLSLKTPAPARQGLHRVLGEMHNVNTYERFKELITPERRAALVQAAADKIWGAICSGAAEADPALLQRAVLLSFADLKIFRFFYWFGFPAIKPPEAFTVERVSSLGAALSASPAVAASCDAWLFGQTDGTGAGTAHAPEPPGAAGRHAAFWLLLLLPDGRAESHPLSEWQQLRGRGGEVWLAFADHSSDAGSPGWALRNALLLAAARWGLGTLRVAAVRLRRGLACTERSLALTVRLPAVPAGWGEGGVVCVGGWEGNERGKPGARRADLGGAMDPTRLAEAAVDLNLRLMKWRAAPDLDTARLAAAKCLLLGAGTLGCAVARVLLGWGVRVITLVDAGRVAYSNPVRQSLYEFADCAGGGRPKAEAAAAALARVFPSVRARGVQLCIPMPGHPLSPGEVPQAEADTAALEALVAEHDAVFLLTDTRESRWLPSLLGAAGNKIVLNAALGFDSFLVMRHGAAPDAGEGAPGSSGAAGSSAAGGSGAGARLGCYFCNDVVAPLDSTRDRSLEQQCTVARPGLAGIAGSLAVEMCCGVLQHPAGVRAPAACHDDLASSSGALPLGPVPHMVRGQLGGGFAQHAMVGQAFRQCIACSGTVVDAYRAQGWPFVLAALQDPRALEDLTGLTELHASTALLMVDADDSEDEAEQSLLAPEEKTPPAQARAGKEEDWLEL